jgi:hypothetical protein
MLTDGEPKVKGRNHMISDVLDAVEQIDAYLRDPIFTEVYQGGLLTRIRLVRHAMEDLRQELDTPPSEER